MMGGLPRKAVEILRRRAKEDPIFAEELLLYIRAKDRVSYPELDRIWVDVNSEEVENILKRYCGEKWLDAYESLYCVGATSGWVAEDLVRYKAWRDLTGKPIPRRPDAMGPHGW